MSRTTNKFRLSILALVVSCGLVLPASGQVHWVSGPAFEEYTAATAHPSAAKVSVQLGQGIAQGSGTAIAHHNGGTVILTNHHVIEGGSRVSVCIGGSCHQAQVLGSERGPDFALLWIRAQVPIVQLGDSVPEGVMAQFRAFDGGTHYRVWHGKILGFNYDSYRADTYSVSGDSGGGVFVQGRLVGVLWGNRNDKLAFCGIGPIRRMLTRLGIGVQYVPVAVPIQNSPPPTVPTPAPPQQPPASPADCGCRERFANIEKILADYGEELQSLNMRASKFPEHGPPGPAGPQGERGPRGPAGVPGTPGSTAEVTQLELRINVLEAQLAELRASTPVSWDIVPKE